MSRMRSSLIWVICPVLSVATAVGLIVAWGLFSYGTAFAIPALARGQLVMVEPRAVSLGSMQAGQRYAATFELVNLCSRPVFVNGMRANCTCVSSAEDLPFEVSARNRRAFRLWVRPADVQAGQPFTQRVNLFLSIAGHQTSLTVLGAVVTSTAPR